MRIYKNSILKGLFFTFLAINLYSQPIKSVKFEVMLKTADDCIEAGDYYNALEWYGNAYKEVKSEDVALSMAFSYYKMRDFANAERWYERVLDKDKDHIFIDDRYAYGRVLRSQGKFVKAREQFDVLMNLSDDDALKRLAQLEITGIDQMNQLEANRDVFIGFISEDINSGSGEYSPNEYDEKTLYFSSFNARKEIVLDGKEKAYHAKIYSAAKGSKGWEKPKELNKSINREGYHSGGVCFSRDKRKMYFTRQTIENDKVTTSSIYISVMGDKDWSTPRALSSVNGEWVATQPSMGELYGEEVLFFASNKDGGIGGFDIYYAPIRGEDVGQAINLGEIINTDMDEISPHYYDGKLYFSTDARPGMGGLDIYFSEWNGSKWSIPNNMGKNYNTLYDDYSFAYNLKGTNGYLVSNRPDPKKKKLKSETCCYDIYRFEKKELVIELLVGVGSFDEKPLNGANVEVSDLTSYDLPQSQTQEEEYRFNFLLDSERKYRVITSKEGYFSDTTEFNTNGIIEDTNIRKKVLLKQKEQDPRFTTQIVTINEPIRLNNIYYDLDKWNILKEAEEDLNILLNLMNEYPDLVIELSSHTDSQGLTNYNEDLSQKRAESSKQWLLTRGIAENRIVAKGYGESVILNKCGNGVRCTDDEHRFNRRTEFKIIAGPQTIEIKREIKSDGK